MAIHMSRIDELALITLDRPEALNALSFGQLHDLNRILDSIADSDARALLVTGSDVPGLSLFLPMYDRLKVIFLVLAMLRTRKLVYLLFASRVKTPWHSDHLAYQLAARGPRRAPAPATPRVASY